MPFDVVVSGRIEHDARRALADWIGASAICADGTTSVLTVTDQPQLVSVLSRLTALGMNVEHVRRTDAGQSSP